MPPAEARFWTIVKNSQLGGKKFRRQHSIGRYILDFYCPSERLGVELDGQVHFHDRAREYDYERKLFLEHYRIKVLRFENRLVFENEEIVIHMIRSCYGWKERTTPSAEAAATPPL
jgi:very-short-patch-repair endonuclease